MGFWTVADELDSLLFVRQCISMASTCAGHRWYALFCHGLSARTITYVLSADPGKRVQQKRLRTRQWYGRPPDLLSLSQILTIYKTSHSPLLRHQSQRSSNSAPTLPSSSRAQQAPWHPSSREWISTAAVPSPGHARNVWVPR